MEENKNRKLLRNQSDQFKEAAVEKGTTDPLAEEIPINESEVGSEADTKTKIKYGTKYLAALGILSEYCDNSAIPGIKYFGTQKRPYFERIFWVCVFITSTSISSYLIMNLWDKWKHNPVIVSFSEKATPVWQIPFPSVTVCPETKSTIGVFNFSDILPKIILHRSITEQEDYLMEAISQICLPYPDMLNVADYGKDFVNASDLIKAMEETTTKYDKTFRRCMWRNHNIHCNKFHKVLTEEGLCYSFNALDPKDIYRDEALIDGITLGDGYNETVRWNLEYGYNIEAGTDTYPYRALNDGAKSGLFLFLEGMYQENDQICRGGVHGFKILLNTPGEVPQASKIYHTIPFNKAALISIKPQILSTSEGLKRYEPLRRQCYFQNERYLRYFKIYTQNNCKLECLSNITMEHCGCVKFSMPTAKIRCMDEAEDVLAHEEFRQGLESTTGKYHGAADCYCLPACTSISYDVEISQAKFELPALYNDLKLNGVLEQYPEMRASKLSIFFKEAQFLTSKRSELYSNVDFLASCGGLLGLFMGFSAVTIVELVYFCTVRLLTNLKMRNIKDLELERLQETE